MKIVLIHGQNHQGSSCHIGRMIAEKITGEKEITEFFLPRDLNHAHLLYAGFRAHEGVYRPYLHLLDGASAQSLHV